MVLYRIEDFKTAPSGLEYAVLYTISSVFVVLFSYSIMGQISAVIGAISLLLFLMATYIFVTIRRVRQERAIQFFCASLKVLSPKDLKALAKRYRPSDLEHQIIEQRISTLKNDDSGNLFLSTTVTVG